MNNSFNSSTNLPQLNVISQSQHQQTQNVAETAAASNLLQTPPNSTNIGGYLQQTHSLHHNQLPQLAQHQQYATAMGSTHSAAIFDSRQLQTLNALDKTYYAGATTNVAAVNSAAAAAAAAASATVVNGRYYATSANSQVGAAPTHSNTILITNNFTQATAPPQLTLPPQAPEHAQQQRPTISGVTAPNNFSNSNLRIVTAAPNALQQQSHIFNINNNIGKDPIPQQQLTANDLYQLQQQQQLYQQQQQHHQFLQRHSHFSQQQQHQLSALVPHQTQISAQLQAAPHYAQQHFIQQQQQQQHALPMQQFYTQTDESNIAAIANTEMLPTIVNNAAIAPTTGVTAAPPPSAAATNTSSTVVLDRINICINNHYTDAASPASVASSISTTPSQQPSPIIPAIQHKAVVDSANGLLISSYGISDSTSIVIDEPDSTTTTPQTPPTTPENISSTQNIVGAGTGMNATANAQSPSCTTTTPKNYFYVAAALHETITAEEPVIAETNVQKSQFTNDIMVPPTPLTPPTPPKSQLLPPSVQTQSPTLSPPVPSPSAPSLPTSPIRSPSPSAIIVSFAVGEDVLIRRNDERFYLGTIIDTAQQKYLIRFDDKSEIWSSADTMRKFAVSNDNVTGQMCVACKRSDSMDIVETCERCGRGYHRNCTDEVTPGCDAWMCKRCAKPMKMIKTSICLDRKLSVCHQLPYNVDSLNWDDKHRVNEEQIYCYCGKSGKFDHNMLQCCRCKNWFHTDCMRCFKNTILRGDGFFVFCCSVCNIGEEFLRRLQMNWVDFIHLTLYNLSAIKKHQNQKYHHLTKDIWPFALEKRYSMPIPKTWAELPEEEFKEKIKHTLKENSDRFMSGKENKKDHFYYALRHNGPPILPSINIKPDDILSNELITEHFKLTLLKGAPENESLAVEPIIITDDDTASEVSIAKPEHENDQDVDILNDIYEFRIEDEDEKFTSDDEIPIKHIIEKAKKHKKSTNCTTSTTLCNQKYNKSKTLEKMDVDDSNFSNIDAIPSHQIQKTSERLNQKKESITDSIESSNNNNIIMNKTNRTANIPTKNSRKRKAFTLSKSYKETSIDVNSRICDSSSDENSSSSRSTSLDLIIPPPKNFLGLNNPFRIVTPKKNSLTGGVGCIGDATDKKAVSLGRRGTIIKNSIFTTSLDFTSKLAALKSSGIFSNLSSSELAKAAGQPRLVRTIKRRLSAKDITIGPNQEVRRRRIRRLSASVEVISTTTINQIPSNFFPIHAKDLITNPKLNFTSNQHSQNTSNNNISTSATISSVSSSSADSASTIKAKSTAPPPQPTHGRRLRQRPEKSSPNNSRRSSISGASTSSNSSLASATISTPTATTIQDLKQSVNKYFGAVNRIESGEQFSIRAKRLLANGQMQYLIEWGGDMSTA